MSNMLSYKGYHASVEYDAEDEILVGTVFGVRDTLAFHGSSIPELTETFHDCIDTYLQICAEQGLSPDKQYRGSFNIRISPELHRKAALAAEQNGISLNQLIQEAIEDRVTASAYRNVSIMIPVTQNIISVHAKNNTSVSLDRYQAQAYSQFGQGAVANGISH